MNPVLYAYTIISMTFQLFLHLLLQLLFLLPNLLQLLVPGLTQTLPAIILILKYTR